MKKNASQPRKQTSELNPADHLAARPMDNSGAVCADNPQELADLVWKYFAEEITEAVIEIQEALTLQQSGPKKHVTRWKN